MVYTMYMRRHYRYMLRGFHWRKVASWRQLVMIMIRTRALMKLYCPHMAEGSLVRLTRVCKKCVTYWNNRFIGVYFDECLWQLIRYLFLCVFCDTILYFTLVTYTVSGQAAQPHSMRHLLHAVSSRQQGNEVISAAW